MNDPPASVLGTSVFQPTPAPAPPADMSELSGLTLDQLEAKVAQPALAVETESAAIEPPPEVEPEPSQPAQSSEPPPPIVNESGGDSPRPHGKLPLLIGGAVLLVVIIIVVLLTRGGGSPSTAVQSPTVTVNGKTSTLTLPKDASFTNLKAQAATITKNLTVGQQAAVGSLSVNGNASLSGTLSIGGSQICTNSGCTPASGSNSYLQNGGGKQTANFHIQSAAANAVGGVIQAANRQTADLLQLQNSGGSVLAKIDAGGNLTVQAATVNGALGVGGSVSIGGNLSVNGHFISGGGTPHVSVGAAAGGGTAGISGNDTFGSVTVTTGSPSSSGTLITISFASAFSGTPHVVISPANASAAGAQYYTGSISTGSFQIDVAAIPAGSATYSFNYFVGQ